MGSSCADGIPSTTSAVYLCPALSSFPTYYGHCDYRTRTSGAENLSFPPLQGLGLCLHPLQGLALRCQDESGLPCNSVLHSKSCCSDTTCREPQPSEPLLQQQHFPCALLLPCCRSSAPAVHTEPPALCNPKPWHKQQIIMTLHPARDRFPKRTLDTLPSL